MKNLSKSLTVVFFIEKSHFVSKDSPPREGSRFHVKRTIAIGNVTQFIAPCMFLGKRKNYKRLTRDFQPVVLPFTTPIAGFSTCEPRLQRPMKIKTLRRSSAKSGFICTRVINPTTLLKSLSRRFRYSDGDGGISLSDVRFGLLTVETSQETLCMLSRYGYICFLNKKTGLMGYTA